MKDKPEAYEAGEGIPPMEQSLRAYDPGELDATTRRLLGIDAPPAGEDGTRKRKPFRVFKQGVERS